MIAVLALTSLHDVSAKRWELAAIALTCVGATLFSLHSFRSQPTSSGNLHHANPESAFRGDSAV